MKRLGIRPATGDRGSQLKAMVEEEVGRFGEKKRRLSAEKVKALEKSFEIDNKLEPERKAKLALEMDLQPRQVAVWFQNRRARWKAKQLERDYGLLKASYDAIKLSFDVLQRDKEALVKQVGQLRSKLKESEEEGKNEAGDAGISVIEVEGMRVVSEPESERQGDASEEMLLLMMVMKDLNQEGEVRHGTGMRASSPAVDLKDGSSDSDSSAVFQEARSPLTTPPSLAKMEEHDFFVGEGARYFFSEQQAPTLQWGCSDRWN